MLTTIAFFVIAFVAAAVASVAGFGSATMTIPFLSWIIGFKQAIILIAFFHGFSNLFHIHTPLTLFRGNIFILEPSFFIRFERWMATYFMPVQGKKAISSMIIVFLPFFGGHETR